MRSKIGGRRLGSRLVAGFRGGAALSKELLWRTAFPLELGQASPRFFKHEYRDSAMPVSDPYFDEGMRNYIARVSRNNLWRVAGADFLDLVQEGYLCYLTCLRRYVGRRPTRRPNGQLRRYLPPKRPDHTAQKHFMRLVQMTFRNRIATLAKRQSALKERSVWLFSATPEQSEWSIWEMLLPPEQEQATITCLLKKMPNELVALFGLLTQDIQEPYRRIKLGRRTIRETSDEHYSRLLGLPADTDLSGMVQAYFYPA